MNAPSTSSRAMRTEASAKGNRECCEKSSENSPIMKPKLNPVLKCKHCSKHFASNFRRIVHENKSHVYILEPRSKQNSVSDSRAIAKVASLGCIKNSGDVQSFKSAQNCEIIKKSANNTSRNNSNQKRCKPRIKVNSRNIISSSTIALRSRKPKPKHKTIETQDKLDNENDIDEDDVIIVISDSDDPDEEENIKEGSIETDKAAAS